MLRPFPFETPIAPEALIDRREELHRLSQAAAERVHVRLAGPRRFGKTSLLLAHAAGLQGAGWRTVHVDMYGVTSLAEVCVRIATSYSRLRDSRLRAHLDSLGGRLGLSLTPAGPGITLGPRQRIPSPEATQTAAAELLDLPLTLHERDQIPTLVVFDEFQDLLSAGSGLDGLLRSHVQYHGDAAVYIYAGSQPSLMRKLFSDRERPLYGQAEPLELGPLPADEVLVELSERFEELGEDPRGALAPLVGVAAGHPQRTMLLAHLLHRELAARDVGTTTLSEGAEVEDIALADAVVRRALSMTHEAHQARVGPDVGREEGRARGAGRRRLADGHHDRAPLRDLAGHPAERAARPRPRGAARHAGRGAVGLGPVAVRRPAARAVGAQQGPAPVAGPTPAGSIFGLAGVTQGHVRPADIGMSASSAAHDGRPPTWHLTVSGSRSRAWAARPSWTGRAR